VAIVTLSLRGAFTASALSGAKTRTVTRRRRNSGGDSHLAAFISVDAGTGIVISIPANDGNHLRSRWNPCSRSPGIAARKAAELCGSADVRFLQFDRRDVCCLFQLALPCKLRILFEFYSDQDRRFSPNRPRPTIQGRSGISKNVVSD